MDVSKDAQDTVVKEREAELLGGGWMSGDGKQGTVRMNLMD